MTTMYCTGTLTDGPDTAACTPARLLRVLLADDHAVVRAGLTQLLGTAPDMSVVGEAADGAEAAQLAGELQPDVVLMDLSMPGVDGVEATRTIMRDCPGTEVVALTSFSDRGRVMETFDAGAVGYVLKDAAPEEVLRAIRLAAQGLSAIDPRVARILLTAHSRPAVPAFGLTAREHEVLGLLSQGCSNRAIGRRLAISEATVKAHLTSVFQTIGVTDRTSAALWAHRNGLAVAADVTA